MVSINDASWKAGDIARQAAELIEGDRDRSHGEKADNFDRIATMWTAWLAVRWGSNSAGKVSLDGHDVGVMMALMKMARTQSGEPNIDDYVDGVGYMACAGELREDLNDG